MAKKNSRGLNVWILFATATLLLAAGWLMKPFPVLIFAALAPLFAISDQAREHPSPWNRFELILLALSIGLLAAHAFDLSTLIPVLLQAILFTFVFVGYAFAYKNLGARLGKFTIIFFWLGLEYLVLKLPWHTKVVYLADSILLKPDWYTWTTHTGYLGVTLWILVANLLFYLGLFRSSGFNIYFLISAILLVAAPILYSLQNENSMITYSHMMQLYGSAPKGSLPQKYLQQGELIARTAAWVSVLIILLSFVKNYTRKK